jgi:hypothetical protein
LTYLQTLLTLADNLLFRPIVGATQAWPAACSHPFCEIAVSRKTTLVPLWDPGSQSLFLV